MTILPMMFILLMQMITKVSEKKLRVLVRLDPGGTVSAVMEIK